ncbi:anti-sigma regulatory factor [Noviherbaspirillum galbum]|uniref:Anti-sigma regulatory factor n=1 Tax=Noviherbaspirillum galbum TaxID=2709383 RepID=A0A6B3SLE0_9BURK|nr:anti-sigma regulatory factor [Noviherbaspirillum galbum]NEX59456.1 anti-sigma regulatory factor [Noviherbaspirillum galbum]
MDAVVVPLRTDEDVVRLRQAVRSCLVSVGFSLIDQTKLITAASELARNTVKYGGGGEAHLIRVSNGPRQGATLVFVDHGPGIPDIAKALTDGYTTGSGMGLGLGGAKRLSDEFDIVSEPGKGTTVKITKWKPF